MDAKKIKKLRRNDTEKHGEEYEQQLRILQSFQKKLEKLPEEVRILLDQIEEEYWILKDIEIEESFVSGFCTCMRLFQLE